MAKIRVAVKKPLLTLDRAVSGPQTEDFMENWLVFWFHYNRWLNVSIKLWLEIVGKACTSTPRQTLWRQGNLEYWPGRLCVQGWACVWTLRHCQAPRAFWVTLTHFCRLSSPIGSENTGPVPRTQELMWILAWKEEWCWQKIMMEAADFYSFILPRVIVEWKWVRVFIMSIMYYLLLSFKIDRSFSSVGELRVSEYKVPESKHIWASLLHLSMTLVYVPVGNCLVIKKSGFGLWIFLYGVRADPLVSSTAE